MQITLVLSFLDGFNSCPKQYQEIYSWNGHPPQNLNQKLEIHASKCLVGNVSGLLCNQILHSNVECIQIIKFQDKSREQK
jgi:hypothetical protein